jgi:lipoprotein-anchoring transpeptidase ErfK/SrfK
MGTRVLLLVVTFCAVPTLVQARVRPHTDRMLRLQVQLDAAHFPAGEIDGAAGLNTRRALAALHHSTCNGTPAAPRHEERPALTTYVIREEDAAGPIAPVPDDLMEKAKLEALVYTSIVEALAERFHASPRLLRELNPRSSFAAGETIRVPNVQRETLPRAAKVVVDVSDRSVTLLDRDDCRLARYPASMGSDKDPLPVGTWKVTEKLRDPVFFYNPELFWDADPGHSTAKLPPGPNNPVGVVWIGLSKEHLGIHGTPEPSTIARTQSHGCIRLTNWDAAELAQSVSVGTPVILQE